MSAVAGGDHVPSSLRGGRVLCLPGAPTGSDERDRNFQLRRATRLRVAKAEGESVHRTEFHAGLLGFHFHECESTIK